MVLGAARVVLHVHGSRSLKQKRGVFRSISRRVRDRFNVSVAEVEGQDTWQRLVVGLGAVGSHAPDVRERLEKAIDYIEALHLAELLDQEVEVLSTPLSDYEEPAHWEPEEP